MGNGSFAHLKKDKWTKVTKNNFFCIAGGSGLTPIWQIVDIANKNNESVNITLI